MKAAAKKSTKRKAETDGRRDSLRLDGNAAAGLLSELFVPDLTTARAKCAGCRTDVIVPEASQDLSSDDRLGNPLNVRKPTR